MSDKKQSYAKTAAGIAWVWKYLHPTLGAFWLAVLLMLVRTASQVIMPLFAGNAVDQATGSEFTKDLPLIVGILGGLMLLAGVLQFVYRFVSQLQDQRIGNRLTAVLFRKIANAPLEKVYSQNASYWQSRIRGDARSLTAIYPHNLTMRLSSAFRAIVFGTLVAMISLHLLVCVLIVTPICGWMIVAIRRRIKNIGEIQSELTSANAGWLADVVRALPLVKLSGWEEREADELERRCDVEYKECRRVERLRALAGGAGRLIQRAVPLLVYYYAILLVSRDVITSGQFVSFAMYSSMLISSFQSTIRARGKIEDALVSMDRVKEILGFPEENDAMVRTGRLEGPIREIELREVSFAYPDVDENLTGVVRERLNEQIVGPRVPSDSDWVLRNINLRLSSGSPSVLVGMSGAGKSTIAYLLCGFYLPTSGKVLVNGIDLRNLDLEDYRRRLSAISHEGFVLNRSFHENACYRLPDGGEQTRKEELVTYITELGLDGAATKAGRQRRRRERRIAKGLPERLPPDLIPSGSPRLSGGERQRLLLLRELMHDSSCWLLDETTSNVDAILEERIFDILLGRPDQVVLAVSHRFSCIQRFVRIHVLAEGRIVSSGSHSELFRDCPEYRDLVMPQVRAIVADNVNGSLVSTPQSRLSS